MGQRVGLKYLVLHDDLDRLGLPPDEWQQMKDDVRVMELEALAVMNEKKD